jgi:hypothetical protein
MPSQQNAGSVVRQLWNLGAVVQMHTYGISWGGSLALKREVFTDRRVIERWRRHPTEDTSLHDALTRLGLREATVPAAIMTNRESSDLAGAFRFIRRQMLWVWFSHSCARSVAGYALAMLVLLLAPPILAVLAAVVGRFDVALIAGGAWLAYQLGLTSTVAATSRLPRRQLAVRGEVLRPVYPTPWYVAAGLVTQVLYPLAVLSAIMLRTVDWRGVTYRVEGPTGFRMTAYRPFQAPRVPHERKLDRVSV